ncbi:MAG: hypothetical protein ACTIJ1_05070 [Mesonia sp.]|uniref:hypothetical protein n=1 Tax=Mesonia sp. TaxID=1960830 RepID=UPI003F973EF3
MKTTLLFLFGIFSISISAQTTSIPDEGFEQALIDLGIDSDQSINGQVLTSDIANVTDLDLLDSNIQDPSLIHSIAGIEDFVSLKVLDMSYLYGVDNGGTLDLSSLIDLEEFYMKGGEIEGADYEVVILDNNPNLNT